jgi:hypothetical protein
MTLPNMLPADIVKGGAVEALTIVRGQGQDPLEGFGFSLKAKGGRKWTRTGGGWEVRAGKESKAAAEGNDNQACSRLEGQIFVSWPGPTC